MEALRRPKNQALAGAEQYECFGDKATSTQGNGGSNLAVIQIIVERGWPRREERRSVPSLGLCKLQHVEAAVEAGAVR